jgi:hypothetical protein
MTTTPTPTVDQLAENCFMLACDEATEIMGGPEHITLDDLTGCETIVLLTAVRPAWERKRLARRYPAPVLTLRRPKSTRRSAGGGER